MINPHYCTIGELIAALKQAINETLGTADAGRDAEMADVGSVFLALQERTANLRFVDGRPRLG